MSQIVSPDLKYFSLGFLEELLLLKQEKAHFAAAVPKSSPKPTLLYFHLFFHDYKYLGFLHGSQKKTVFPALSWQ